MNYCRNYDIECPFALSEYAPVPCIGSWKQCDEFRKGTQQKTLGNKIDVEDIGIATVITRSKANEEPDRKQHPENYKYD